MEEVCVILRSALIRTHAMAGVAVETTAPHLCIAQTAAALAHLAAFGVLVSIRPLIFARPGLVALEERPLPARGTRKDFGGIAPAPPTAYVRTGIIGTLLARTGSFPLVPQNNHLLYTRITV